MSRPRAVLFGLGGTLVAKPADPGMAIAERLGLDVETARRISMIADGATYDAPAALAARLRSEIGLAEDALAVVTAIWTAASAAPAVAEGAPTCVGAVHAAGARTAVVADAWTPFADAARTVCVPFATAIDRWFLSSEAAAFRADGSLLAAALTALEVAPGDVLVIGEDLERDLKPALAVGAAAIWLRHDAGGSGAIPVDPHGAARTDAAVVVPESAVVVHTLMEARRAALTWLWAARGRRVDLTAPLPA
jgi:FMN phosphatase YigB (HAD superfamily)